MRNSGSPKVSTPASILLVGHNKSGLAARRAVLEELGYRITPAASGEEALEHYSKTKFDLVVTDHKLGRMDGIGLIRKIRDVAPSARVIMLSVYVEALGLTEAATGADIVLAKGANEVTHLVRGVARLLRLRPPKKPAASQKASAHAKRASTSTAS